MPHAYINKTINSLTLVGRRGGVSVAFRKIVSPDSRELCTIREWRDFSGTDSTGLPLISAALARRDRPEDGMHTRTIGDRFVF